MFRVKSANPSVFLGPKAIKDVTIMERLGEGKFGEVYKGLWQVKKINCKYNL